MLNSNQNNSSNVNLSDKLTALVQRDDLFDHFVQDVQLDLLKLTTKSISKTRSFFKQSVLHLALTYNPDTNHWHCFRGGSDGEWGEWGIDRDLYVDDDPDDRANQRLMDNFVIRTEYKVPSSVRTTIEQVSSHHMPLITLENVSAEVANGLMNSTKRRIKRLVNTTLTKIMQDSTSVQQVVPGVKSNDDITTKSLMFVPFKYLPVKLIVKWLTDDGCWVTRNYHRLCDLIQSHPQYNEFIDEMHQAFNNQESLQIFGELRSKLNNEYLMSVIKRYDLQQHPENIAQLLSWSADEQAAMIQLGEHLTEDLTLKAINKRADKAVVLTWCKEMMRHLIKVLYQVKRDDQLTPRVRYGNYDAHLRLNDAIKALSNLDKSILNVKITFVKPAERQNATQRAEEFLRQLVYNDDNINGRYLHHIFVLDDNVLAALDELIKMASPVVHQLIVDRFNDTDKLYDHSIFSLTDFIKLVQQESVINNVIQTADQFNDFYHNMVERIKQYDYFARNGCFEVINVPFNHKELIKNELNTHSFAKRYC